MGLYIGGVEACQAMADYVMNVGLHEYVKSECGRDGKTRWYIVNEFGHSGSYDTKEEAIAHCSNYCGENGNPPDWTDGKDITDGWEL